MIIYGASSKVKGCLYPLPDGINAIFFRNGGVSMLSFLCPVIVQNLLNAKIHHKKSYRSKRLKNDILKQIKPKTATSSGG